MTVGRRGKRSQFIKSFGPLNHLTVMIQNTRLKINNSCNEIPSRIEKNILSSWVQKNHFKRICLFKAV